jgi:Protein of unknown function (DUF2865)
MRSSHPLVTIGRLDRCNPEHRVSGRQMTRFLRGLGPAAFGALALTVCAAAQGYPPPYPAPNYPSQPYPAQQPPQGYPGQQPYPGQAYPAQAYPAQAYPAQSAPSQPVAASPVCVRLEAQLAALNNSAANSALATQIKSKEDAVAKQQTDLDQKLAQARKAGCGQGFFSLFSGLSPQCGPLNSQIDELRGDLDRMMSELEQLKSGTNDQQGQRVALIGELAQNNCGAQYTQAARASGPEGFFQALLGGGGTILNPGGNGAPAGTYSTVCVRTCDGAYFPISYSTVPDRFGADAQTCQRLCPAAEATLYTYRNPGEEIDQAVSVSGAPYTALPNAFRYRKELVSGCACRRPGESWADALHSADDSSTLESGDVIVTDKNQKALTQIPRTAPGKPQPNGATQPITNAAPATPAAANGDAATDTATDPKNRKVRVVGPPFLSQQ